MIHYLNIKIIKLNNMLYYIIDNNDRITIGLIYIIYTSVIIYTNSRIKYIEDIFYELYNN